MNPQPDNYTPHPLAELFPLMADDEYEDLKKDIQEKGLLNPITLLEGKILDGRNRYQACLDTGIEPRFEQYQGEDARGYVISLNLYRRQLSTAQRSLIAARLADKPVGANQHSGSLNSGTLSVAKAAAKLGVSEDSVEKAKNLIKKADPAIIKLVEAPGSGLSLNAACEISKLPIEEQKKVAEKGEVAVKNKANVVREARKDSADGVSKGKPPVALKVDEQKLYAKGSPLSAGRLARECIKSIETMGMKDPNAINALKEVITFAQEKHEIFKEASNKVENSVKEKAAEGKEPVADVLRLYQKGMPHAAGTLVSSCIGILDNLGVKDPNVIKELNRLVEYAQDKIVRFEGVATKGNSDKEGVAA